MLRIPIGDRKGVVLACMPACVRHGRGPVSAYSWASGPRVRGLGVVVAPVDRLGATLKPDPFLTPDSGWNGSGTASAGELAPVITPTAASAKPIIRKHRPWIIVKQASSG